MFFTNYVKLCNKAGLSPSAAAEKMGFHRSEVTRWSKGAMPRTATLHRIADYFGCTVDDLKKDDAAEKKTDGARDDMLKIFDRLSPADQAALVATARALEAARRGQGSHPESE